MPHWLCVSSASLHQNGTCLGQNNEIIDFRFSLWLLIGIDSVLESFHRVDVDSVAEVSKI